MPKWPSVGQVFAVAPPMRAMGPEADVSQAWCHVHLLRPLAAVSSFSELSYETEQW